VTPSIRVLIVDDEPLLGRRVARIFQERGCEALHAGDGAAMLSALEASRWDVLVLDWTLPDADGVDLVRRVRAAGEQVPVLMLTGRDHPDDVVAALEAGADDFVAKRDLEPSVLVARAVALARRSTAPRIPRRIVAGPFVVDEVARHVCVDGEVIHLAPTEMRILARLASTPGELVPRVELIAVGWGAGADVSDNALDTTLRRLRQRLGPHAAAVQSVRERGVQLTVAPRVERPRSLSPAV
jgi:DNA-binding response OmpR family regulator